MGINQLPTELHWLIADHLSNQPGLPLQRMHSTALRDMRNLALSSKVLYDHLIVLWYKLAVKNKTAVLAWAIQGSPECQGRMSAAKRYLAQGGGGAVGSHLPWWMHEMPILDLEDLKLRRQLKQGQRRLSYYRLVTDIKTEIGVVLAQLFRSEGLLTQHQQQIMDWVQLILQHARPKVLRSVPESEWRALLCWLCQHFDFTSDVTINIYRTMSRKMPPTVKAAIISDPRLTPIMSPGQVVPNMRNSLSPMTHLMLSLENIAGPKQVVTSSFKDLAEVLLSDHMSGVEESGTLPYLMIWQRSYAKAYPRMSANTDGNFNHVMLLVNRQLMKQESIPSTSELTFLGQRCLMYASRLNCEVAVKALLDMGVDIDTGCPLTGKTAIMEAGGHTMFDLLHGKGADLAACDAQGYSRILISAIEQRHTTVGSMKVRDGKRRVDAKFVDRIKVIIGANPGLVNRPGEPRGPLPLYLAMCGGDSGKLIWDAGVDYLLKSGADPNLPVLWDPAPGTLYSNPHTTYLVHIAVRERKPQSLVHSLLFYGARPSMRDGNGQTAYQLTGAGWYKMTSKERRQG